MSEIEPVERIVEPFVVVGPHVEDDRQRAIRRDAGARRIEAQLADWDAHPADALVAKPENPLAVGVVRQRVQQMLESDIRVTP